MTQGIDRVYRQCDPAKPLQPNDPRYVSCEGLRGTGDLVGRVADAIRRSDDPMHLLFTGHRGGGKTTELLRLQEMLAYPPRMSTNSSLSTSTPSAKTLMSTM